MMNAAFGGDRVKSAKSGTSHPAENNPERTIRRLTTMCLEAATRSTLAIARESRGPRRFGCSVYLDWVISYSTYTK